MMKIMKMDARCTPHSTAADPAREYAPEYTDGPTYALMTWPKRRPKHAPMNQLGMKNPPGSEVPYVRVMRRRMASAAMAREVFVKGSWGCERVPMRTMASRCDPKKSVASSSYCPSAHPSWMPKPRRWWEDIRSHVPCAHSQSPRPWQGDPALCPPMQTHPVAFTHVAGVPAWRLMQVELSMVPPHHSPQFSASLHVHDPSLRQVGAARTRVKRRHDVSSERHATSHTLKMGILGRRVARAEWNLLKRPPTAPPTHPRRKNRHSSHHKTGASRAESKVAASASSPMLSDWNCFWASVMERLFPKERRPESEMSPVPDHPALMNDSVKVATSALVKMRMMSIGVQCDAASSSANSTPPMGAPNAAAIPAPAPAHTKSRRSRSLWKRARTDCGRAGKRAVSLSMEVIA
mmetsp:Transcript_937/g.2267  ORF Transcript_937/g.2267 Transcript_937/m.2267 type:complete len:406 (-) Transcript_937:964-2181(-)